MSGPERPFSATTVAIIGVGLMGGSLGLAVRAHAGVRRVVGFSRSGRSLAAALDLGAITESCSSLQEACREADIVFVATPVRLIPEHVRQALTAAPPRAVITDMGSTKSTLMAALSRDEQRRFVGGHPLCGAETAGVIHAKSSLYRGATYFLTPGAHTDPDAVQRLFGLLTDIGARPMAVDPFEHDRLMALLSHLPHVIANALMTQAGEHQGARDALLSAGPSFRDMTRVAGANARVWTDIFAENRQALLAALRDFRARLEETTAALEAQDESRVEAQIRRAGEHRSRLLRESSLAPSELFRLIVRVADRPGVFRDIMVALGDAHLNIEDLAMHHESAELGGALTIFVQGEEVCRRAADLLTDLGYDPIVGRVTE
jgi:prephenate dehydrogenase